MRTTRLIILVLALTGLAVAQPASAHRRHVSASVRVGWGGWWGWGPSFYGPGWWGAPGPYAAAYHGVLPTDVAAVDTDISPEHARVYLDGVLIGTADDFDGHPSYLFLKPGRYTLEFKLQGYADEAFTLDVAQGQFFPLKERLARVPTEPVAPWFDRPKGLPVSRVFAPATATAAQPAARARADVTLRPELRGDPEVERRRRDAVVNAALELRVTPSNASIYIDGEFAGTGAELLRLERGLSVAPGEHRIDAMAPGHAPRTLTVSVTGGEQRQIVIDLETKAGQT